MKILFLQPGYAHYRNEFFEILSKRHDIFFLYESSQLRYPGQIKLKNLSYAFGDLKFPKIPWIGILYYILKIRPEIIITSVPFTFRTIASLCYCILFRKKIILWVEEWRHNSNPFSVKELFRDIRYELSKVIYRSADAVIAGGSASFRFCRQIRKSPKHIFLSIQSSVDVSKTITSNIKEKPNDQFTFLYLSRIIDWKGLDILIRAFHKLNTERNDIRLVVGGEGPFEDFCKKLCSDMAVGNVHFLGKIDPANLHYIFSIADVFVLPSYFLRNHYESWGLVINESMSMGLPVITTNAVGASYDLVEKHVNGFVVNENDVGDLHNAMKRILDMDLISLGKNSRALFERKNSFREMADVFTSAIYHVNHLNS